MTTLGTKVGGPLLRWFPPPSHELIIIPIVVVLVVVLVVLESVEHMLIALVQNEHRRFDFGAGVVADDDAIADVVVGVATLVALSLLL